MSPGAWYDHNPYGTRQVIGTVGALMRTDGLDSAVLEPWRRPTAARRRRAARWGPVAEGRRRCRRVT
ncbi:hypothetical protein [Streptomyces leeuwenhoekii]|uniref:Uncharacterized protein n=1 Tax=Streptomyces leeuwenhoekii TaxID=1437453 RepID=A0A0F7VNB1_STRLW|nr:hypothetical protein [Streptomyces leeuwenhoekii]CQR59738.1 Hypothetical Protein sle_02760 [Streptomyces leeuwenhoekii]